MIASIVLKGFTMKRLEWLWVSGNALISEIIISVTLQKLTANISTSLEQAKYQSYTVVQNSERSGTVSSGVEWRE